MRASFLSKLLIVSMIAAALAATPAMATGGDTHCDINGDGYDDLLATSPQASDKGQMTIIFGSNTKLQLADRQTFSRLDIDPTVHEADGNIGDAFDCIDINGDSFADVILGVPSARVAVGNLAFRPGAIYALYGSPGGIDTSRHQYYHRNIFGVSGTARDHAGLGASVAAGDFDGDGYGDVAVGAPGDTIGGLAGAGSVQVFYGKPGGLGKHRDRVYHRNRDTVMLSPEQSAGFGAALTVGDFNGDGKDDLAIGVPLATVAGESGGGQVHILYGSSQVLDGTISLPDHVIDRATPGIVGPVLQSANFGRTLTSGDYDGDGFDDLATAIEIKKTVHVIRGSQEGVTGAGDYVLHRAQPGVAGSLSKTHFWGRNLASGDLDGDTYDDLIVGSSADIVGGLAEMGSVHVFYGGVGPMSGVRDQRLHQNSPGIKDRNDSGDYFGVDTAIGDYDGNGRADLAITVLEAHNDKPNRIAVVYSKATGLSQADHSFLIDGFTKLGGHEWL